MGSGRRRQGRSGGQRIIRPPMPPRRAPPRGPSASPSPTHRPDGAFRSGIVALVGRPNAGKSSLLNALVGERIAAVSSRPQTTRNRVAGIWNPPGMQVVLLDTPGLHEAWTPMNQAMVAAADKVLGEVDAVLWVVDVLPLVERAKVSAEVLDPGLRAIGEKLATARLPLVLVLNKVDAVEKPALLPVLSALAEVAPHIVPLSARKKSGLERLATVLSGILPHQPALFPEDQLTDATERFIVAELIRERIFDLCAEEVPYASAVEIERFDESERELGRVHIHARIIVEKDSQKGILIGAGGRMIKRIGTEARHRIEGLLGCKVRLDLFVAVERDWTRNPRLLRELGVGSS